MAVRGISSLYYNGVNLEMLVASLGLNFQNLSDKILLRDGF